MSLQKLEAPVRYLLSMNDPANKRTHFAMLSIGVDGFTLEVQNGRVFVFCISDNKMQMQTAEEKNAEMEFLFEEELPEQATDNCVIRECFRELLSACDVVVQASRDLTSQGELRTSLNKLACLVNTFRSQMD